MTDSDWKRVRAFLEQALEFEQPERDRWLAAACAEDPELRAEVEALLRAEEGERFEHLERFLEQIAGVARKLRRE